MKKWDENHIDVAHTRYDPQPVAQRALRRLRSRIAQWLVDDLENELELRRFTRELLGANTSYLVADISATHTTAPRNTTTGTSTRRGHVRYH